MGFRYLSMNFRFSLGDIISPEFHEITISFNYFAEIIYSFAILADVTIGIFCQLVYKYIPG